MDDLTRRDAVKLAAAGVAALGAANLLTQDTQAQDKDKDELDVKRLKQITDELIVAISSPPFVAAMKKLKETPIDKRLALAGHTLTPDKLAAAGVKFPKGMRITSRYFEPGIPDIIEVTDKGAKVTRDNSIPGLGGKVGAWACACGGTLGTCGGAGGGT